MPEQKIKFMATVQKITTLADGGMRLGLDLDEKSIPEIAALMELRRLGVVLIVEVSPLIMDFSAEAVRQRDEEAMEIMREREKEVEALHE